MKKDSIEDVQAQLRRSQIVTKNLLEEVEVKNKVIRILLAAGALDKDQLEKATELAGGI